MKHKARNVLVVDDDQAVRQALTCRLSNAGYQVRTAASGEDALLACSPEPPEIVLLDVSMPGMDGFKVCERMRASIDKPITIIFLTGTTHDGTLSLEQLVSQSGGDCFLAKPYDPTLLIELMDRITFDATHDLAL